MNDIDLKELLIESGKRAVEGNISPNFRAIAVGIKQNQTILIKCYLSTVPSNLDYELINDISGEILADTGLDNTEEVCEFTAKSISELDSLYGFIYIK
ncbi:MAG: hypothetical protein AAGC65_23515 [Mucilaginibacter sp.]|uniref:hypothetical protein n=1 Tax=Mucilaginibacter sp. TaxID=1882438 RepID=UPI0031B3B09A